MHISFPGIVQKGFSRVELAITVAGIGFLTLIIYPTLVGFRHKARGESCLNNLKAIQSTYMLFVLDHDADPAHVSTKAGGAKEYAYQPNSAFRLFQSFMSGERTIHLACPADGRGAADSWEMLKDENISYAVNVSASMKGLDDFILAADRNFTQETGKPVLLSTNADIGWNSRTGLHGARGNFVLVFGRVEEADTAGLKDWLNPTWEYPCKTNVMAVP